MPRFHAFYRTAYAAEAEFDAKTREEALATAREYFAQDSVLLHKELDDLSVVEVADIDPEGDENWIDQHTD